jgi:hypothetical protein
MPEEKVILLSDLYPIGLSQDPDFRISVAVRQRFERWRRSGHPVWRSEAAARMSIPGAFAHGGAEFCTFSELESLFYRAQRGTRVEKCTFSFKRFYPLADGRLIVKAVSWVLYPDIMATEFGVGHGRYEALHYFADLTDFPFLWRGVKKAEAA